VADVDSVVNSNVVTSIGLTSILYPDSVLNVNQVTAVSVTSILYAGTIVNTNTVNDVNVIRISLPETIINANSVSGLFLIPGLSQVPVGTILNGSTVSEVALGDRIILASVLNQNFVGEPSVPQNAEINLGTIVNQNYFGTLICKVQAPDVPATAPTDPVSRPMTNILAKSEKTLDGQIGERVAVFKDLSISFRAHPLTGEPVRVLNYNSVNQAFKNIILTNRKERQFGNIELGSDVKARLFEVMTPAVERDLKEEIQRSILNFEPRVLVLKVTSTRVDSNPNAIQVRVEYKIKTFEQTGVFEVFLERI